jgi:hypothetical protein
MNPETFTTELADLLASGRAQAALELCEQRQAQGAAGASYYAFWRERLMTRNRGAIDGEPLTEPMHRELIRDFARHTYVVHENEALPAAAELEAARNALMNQSPFKGDIYLPTAKVPAREQVRGLRRVAQLTASPNLEATAHRFDLLKQWVKARNTKRVFVIGNGPSLKKTDLSLLKDEVTIGFNGIFLHEDFTPTIYVVEDHLVAEDRVKEIHAYRCPVKIFPSYLGYCIEPQDNTIFLNHRPRISYPVDTDFSADAGRISYTGGTVTYTGLQIAASLGVEEIILIGVDASYKVHNVERSDTYGTGVLTSTEDDTNHFDPRYFGKGYRWHDPNVHTMLQAYRKAREFGRDNGVRIVNAGIGGELEVFPRVDFHQLFPLEQVFPRLAVLDFTSVNRLSATGIVKKNLLAGWPKSSQLHVYSDEKARLIAFQNVPNDLYAPGADATSVWPAFRSLVEFDPQVLYLRPTLDRVPMTVLQAVAAAVLGKPWVVHYMDDWLEKAKTVRSPEVAAAYRELMAWFFAGASQVFSICPKMSEHLVDHHGVTAPRVTAVHNMLPDLPAPSRQAPPLAATAGRVVRYFGGLEPDMGLATVIEVARQIDQLNAAGSTTPLRFEVITSPHAVAARGHDFATFRATTLLPATEDYGAYLACLRSSDLNLICYNFDDASVGYVRLSLANKLPELISAGAPFLAIGHPEIGTLQMLRNVGYPFVLTDPKFELRTLLPALFGESPVVGRDESLTRLREEFSDENNRLKMHRLLRARAEVSTERVDPLPLLALQTLVRSAEPGLKHCADLNVLLRLPRLGPQVLRSALGRVRSHGRAWSIRDESNALRNLLKSEQLLATDPALQARALAQLVCGLGHERFEPVDQITRSWLLNHS